MTILHRRVIAASFFAGYLVAAPVLLFYASGYRYNKKKGFSVEAIAAFTVATRPKGAQVYVNGTLWHKTTPTRITDLLPNTYQVRVVKEGYSSWEGGFDLSPGENKILRDISLFPLTQPHGWPVLAGVSEIMWNDPVSGWTVAAAHQAQKTEERGGPTAGTLGIFMFQASSGDTVFLGDAQGFSLLSAAPHPTKDELAVLFRQKDATYIARVSYPFFAQAAVLRSARVRDTLERLRWQDGGNTLWFSGSEGVGVVGPASETNVVLPLPMEDFLANREGEIISVEAASRGAELRVRKVGDLSRVSVSWALERSRYAFIPWGDAADKSIALHAVDTKRLLVFDRAGSPATRHELADIDQPTPLSSGKIFIRNPFELLLWDGAWLRNGAATSLRQPSVVTRVSSTITSALVDEQGHAVFYTTKEGVFAIVTQPSRPYWTQLLSTQDAKLLGMSSGEFLVFVQDGSIYRYPLQ